VAGSLLIDGATGDGTVTLGPLTVGIGGLTIDGHLGGVQTVRLNGPSTVNGGVTILGGLLDDQVVVAGGLTVTQGDLSIIGTDTVVVGSTGRSEVTVDGPLTVAHGGLTIDDHLGLGQTVRLNGPTTVNGNVSILGGTASDQLVVTGSLAVTGGLLIDGATGQNEVTLNGQLVIGAGGLTIDGDRGERLTARLNAPATVIGNVLILGGGLADTIELGAPLHVTAGKLTIDTTLSAGDELLGLDTVTLGGNVTTYGGDINVDAATIRVGATLDTRNANVKAGNITLGFVRPPDDGNPDTREGKIPDALGGQTITVGAGARLLADSTTLSLSGDVTLAAFVRDVSGALPVDVAPSPDPSITVGPGAEIRGAEISLTAHKTSQTSLLPLSLLSLQHKTAKITINGATIYGSGVTIAAKAEDTNPLEDDGTYNVVNNLAIQAPLTYLDIPALAGVPVLSAVSVQKRAADALVNLTGSTIHSTGDVDIGASIDATSEAKAAGGYDSRKLNPLEYVPFSAGYSRAEGSAQTLIGGSGSIRADGNVSITSAAKIEASVQAFTAANATHTQISGAKSVPAVAISVTESDTTSKALVGPGVWISALGNVT
ncbi:MAG: hypothetical protein J0H99_01375, partial [Rhodospirillales bacterium]|nr:hypothetical protein [Rhodospirillales bacterium]